MIFADARVAAVHADYEARAAADLARMRSMPVEQGMAIRDEFLLPVGPEAGALLHALIVGHAPARILELGTSYGYSTLYLADAARQVGARVVTMELSAAKQDHARAELERAGLADVVEFRCGDALDLLAADAREGGTWDFVLVDLWKELYLPCFQAFYPCLTERAVVVADNMIHPVHDRAHARAYRQAVLAAGDMRSTLLAIGQGMELSVRWDADSPEL